MKNFYISHLSQLIIASFFISTASVLGRYIDLPTEFIVWFRSALAMVCIFAFIKFRNIDIKIKSKKHYMPFIISGLFMGAHWITYFYALKLSNVALGILSLYTFPIITALLEPIFLKVKFDPIHLILGFVVVFSMYILAPDFDIESSQVQGVLFGVFSAFLYAVRILMLKKFVTQYNGTTLMFYQVMIITIALIPVLFFIDIDSLCLQLPYLLLLGLLTTSVGHSLMIHSLQFFSVSTASIISSVQPVFGILLAFYFYNEVPKLNTIIGGVFILSTVIFESIRKRGAS